VYPDANNDALCPAFYSTFYWDMPCPFPGLACAYPGRGDGTSDGCNATAMLWCKGSAGVAEAGPADGGADAGGGLWIGAM
jgi:hypothetical protein